MATGAEHIPGVAFQGIPGSFSHLAAVRRFGARCRWLGKQRFKEIFEAVRQGEAEYGIIPIENSLAGSIYENYDLLARHTAHITAELYLRVEHNLAVCESSGASAERVKRLKKVYSHPKALEQCQNFFERHPHIEQSAFADTAGAARHVADSGDLSLGAICSAEAAGMYGLSLLQANIEDNAFNITRFCVIERERRFNDASNKCALIFTTAHEPGSLFRALEVLAKGRTNLTKLESRPIHGRPFEYNFYVDFEFEPGRIDRCEELLDQFRQHTLSLKVLGYFAAAAGQY